MNDVITENSFKYLEPVFKIYSMVFLWLFLAASSLKFSP